MPSKSQAQHNLMAGIAHGWKPSGMKHPPSKKVARKFMKADMAKAKGKSVLHY